IGVVGLAVVLIDLVISIAATFLGTTPARVDQVAAGSYHLAVSLYTNPANAGYALAFAVAPTQAVDGSLTYHTSSLLGKGVDASHEDKVEPTLDDQKEHSRRQLENSKQTGEMQDEAQIGIAGIQSATARQHRTRRVHSPRGILGDQCRAPTVEVASTIEQTP